LKLFKRLFQRKSSTLSPWTARGGWHPAIAELSTSTAGEPVTAETAMRAAAVHSCVTVLEQSVAQLPCLLYERAGREIRRATEHPLYELLHSMPNSGLSAYEYFERLMRDVLLCGNHYSFINRATSARVLELVPLDVGRVRPEASPGGTIVYHVTQPQGGTATYPRDRIFHVRAYSPDGVTGISPIAHARETIGQALAAQRHENEFFSNGLRPCGIYKHPGTLSETARRNLRESLEQRHAGPGNGWRALLLEEGVDWTPLTMSHVDAEFLESRKMTVREICGIFRVPPHMIADLERATFSNIEHQSIDFVSHTLGPWLRRIEGAIRRDLLTPQERARYYPEFLVEGLLRGDVLSRYRAYELGLKNAFLSRNEVRARENLNPRDGGDEFLPQIPGLPEPANEGDNGN